MRFKGLQVFLIIIIAIASFSISGLALAQSSTIYEYYNAGDDAGNGIYGSTWYGQTFNTTASHSIDAVRLKLYKIGTAGYLYVAIRATSGGLPSGPDLTSGVYDASLLITSTTGSYREISLTEYTLAANTQYAIVCYGTGADASNDTCWRSDNTAPSYTGGYYVSSTDDGITWAANTSRDFMFEIYGDPAMTVTSAQVYSKYGEDGDGLVFVVDYTNEVTPYYPDGKPENYFQLQLLDGSTVISSIPLQQWGQRPGSIFLNADQVSALEWGQDYTIRIYGTYGSNPSTTYNLTAADWIGEDSSQLDAWCISLARSMEDHDGVEYLTDGPDGDVLNTAGGAIFAKGIPYLPETRPGIFQYSLSTLEYTETDWTESYPNSLDTWSSWMGPDITSLANDLGDILHVSGKWALGLVLFMFYLVISGIGIFGGHITEGLVLASPMLLLAMNWMIIPMALVASGLMIMVYKWIKGEIFERV